LQGELQLLDKVAVEVIEGGTYITALQAASFLGRMEHVNRLLESSAVQSVQGDKTSSYQGLH
jgi:hypothetical protein